MNYQKIVCWGDSQTFGARTYGCYPLYLVQTLNRSTRYRWRALNLSANGLTARDLWFRLSSELSTIRDVYQACILIGVNDVGNGSPLELFAEYYRQILCALQVHAFRAIYCGEIPPLWPDGHAFFPAASRQRREPYNDCLREIVDECPVARLVEFPNLTADCYTDPVHLNEAGNNAIAERFAQAIMSY